MQNDELVSVVITTFGRTNTLDRAIRSVLSQTYTNIELIVVDDNKDAQLRNNVEHIVKRYPSIKLIENEYNLGGALARNEGIKVAQGKYVAFLDDDDEYCPGKVESQLKLFLKSENTKLALVYCYCRGISAKGTYDYKYNYSGNCVFEGMYECIAATSQWMCLKSALCDVGCFTDTPCKQDSYLIVKLLVNGYSVDRVPEILSIYHDEGTIRISDGNHNKRIIGEEKLRKYCRDHYNLITDEQKLEVEYSFACRLAFHYLAVGDKAKFLRSIKTIISTHPLSTMSREAYKNILKVVLKKWKNFVGLTAVDGGYNVKEHQ